MNYDGKKIEFPAEVTVSFYKLINSLEEQALSSDENQANYAKGLLAEVEKYPALRDGIADIEELDKYHEPIQKLGKLLFPNVLTSNEIKVLTPLFDFKPLITSKRFDNIIEASGEPFDFVMKGVDEDLMYMYCCYFILGSYFSYHVVSSNPQIFEIPDKNTGIIRTYKLLINADLCEFFPTERAKDISRSDYEELINNFGDIELWKSKFPPNSWVLKGISVLNLVDITNEQSISSITSNLLVKSNDALDKIQWGIRKLLSNPELVMGILSLENDYLTTPDKEKMPSIVLANGNPLKCDKEFCDFSYKELIEGQKPFIITDVDAYHKMANIGLSQRLYDSGFKSYMIIPLIHEGEFMGYLELGSPKPFSLHEGTLYLLDNILPILSMAYKRFMTEAMNTVEAIIQQECTTIHPSVKWKFEEEANKFMQQKENGGHPVFHDIIFRNLYPLYGQMDIKGSSSRRNKSVSADLTKQLNAVNNVLHRALTKLSMPVFEELVFRNDQFIHELLHEIAAGSEHKIMGFLKSDVYPVFEHLAAVDKELKDCIQEYWDMLDPELQTVYEERKSYDNNVNQINQRLASFLDEKQVEAQKTFPHYFERYKTDGVEFNMYIGDSINKDQKFHPIYLRNLRIWQLMTMCEMENEYQKIKRDLNSQIEIASLILVYSTPISVHFRMDEKQFDVEGAYNARYEIIKKRVDKAHIKGTDERITRPGSIVIVYSQEQDAQEYRKYLDYMVGMGHIDAGYEDVELEDLQGVHGLRALRADVNYKQSMNFDELILELEEEKILPSNINH